MSWEELESIGDADKAAARAKEKAQELAKAFARTFSTDDGQKVLAYMTNRYIMGNDVAHNETNIDYVAAYKNGEAGVVKAIIHQINIAERL